jgi:hypothetical protein
VKRREYSRRQIQDQFLKLGYRAGFRPHPLNKTITYIELACDRPDRAWIKRQDPNWEITEDLTLHQAAFDLARSYAGGFLTQSGQKIIG